ncbi:MAG TPA: hypothetical protein VEK55_14720 [Xanthobacteraceae bacterium]|nr:hypothetical protein [Xanthobacteraceae bacterium]
MKADRQQKHKGADAPSAAQLVAPNGSSKNCSVAVAFALIKPGKIG